MCPPCFTLVRGSSPSFFTSNCPFSPPPPRPLSNKIMEAHQRGRYRALPFIATPLEQEGGHGQHYSNPSKGSLDSAKDSNSSVDSSETTVIRQNRPSFRKKDEATTIELFYDLFFVANLTSFTSVHAIDSRSSESLSLLQSPHQDVR